MEEIFHNRNSWKTVNFITRILIIINLKVENWINFTFTFVSKLGSKTPIFKGGFLVLFGSFSYESCHTGFKGHTPISLHFFLRSTRYSWTIGVIRRQKTKSWSSQQQCGNQIDFKIALCHMSCGVLEACHQLLWKRGWNNT